MRSSPGTTLAPPTWYIVTLLAALSMFVVLAMTVFVWRESLVVSSPGSLVSMLFDSQGAQDLAGGSSCASRLSPLPPMPVLTPAEVEDTMTCWATRGTFMQDPQLFLDGYPFVKDNNGNHPCAHAEDLFDRRFEASIYWEPDRSCKQPFHHFDGREACRSINGRNILIVGDSVTLQHFESFVGLMQRSMIQLGGEAAAHVWNTTRLNRPYPCYAHVGNFITIGCQLQDVCKGSGYPTFTLTYLRNDRLTLTTQFEKHDGLSDYWQMPWPQHLHNNSILVLNRGPHYVAMDDFSKEYYHVLRFLSNEFMNDTSKDRLVFVRNTPPGHKQCNNSFNLFPPLTRQPSDDLPYFWGEFEKQNRILSELVHKLFFPKIMLLDVDTVTARRPDSHPSRFDCLHYCHPGPIDFWVDLLVNSIRVSSRMVYDDEYGDDVV